MQAYAGPVVSNSWQAVQHLGPAFGALAPAGPCSASATPPVGPTCCRERSRSRASIRVSSLSTSGARRSAPAARGALLTWLPAQVRAMTCTKRCAVAATPRPAGEGTRCRCARGQLCAPSRRSRSTPTRPSPARAPRPAPTPRALALRHLGDLGPDDEEGGGVIECVEEACAQRGESGRFMKYLPSTCSMYVPASRHIRAPRGREVEGPLSGEVWRSSVRGLGGAVPQRKSLGAARGGAQEQGRNCWCWPRQCSLSCDKCKWQITVSHHARQPKGLDLLLQPAQVAKQPAAAGAAAAAAAPGRKADTAWAPRLVRGKGDDPRRAGGALRWAGRRRGRVGTGSSGRVLKVGLLSAPGYTHLRYPPPSLPCRPAPTSPALSAGAGMEGSPVQGGVQAAHILGR